MLGNIGASELLLILLIVLVMFGGNKLPELSKNIGVAIRELKKGLEYGNSRNYLQKPREAKK